MVRTKKWSSRVAAAFRWLHIYLSMFGFTAILLFSVTGITLNHPEWFGVDAERQVVVKGKVTLDWVALPAKGEPKPSDSNEPSSDAGGTAEAKAADEGDTEAKAADLIETSVDKLSVAEFLRAEHHLRGAVKEFRVDEYECLVSFRGPGYSADAFVNREDGTYELTIADHGWVAILNDLHKGRDTGPRWSVLIDLSAILMTISSLTGVILLFYLKRKRISGVLTAIAGTILVVLAYYLFIE